MILYFPIYFGFLGYQNFRLKTRIPLLNYAKECGFGVC